MLIQLYEPKKILRIEPTTSRLLASCSPAAPQRLSYTLHMYGGSTFPDEHIHKLLVLLIRFQKIVFYNLKVTETIFSDSRHEVFNKQILRHHSRCNDFAQCKNMKFPILISDSIFLLNFCTCIFIMRSVNFMNI